jgi:hypothetical protein
MHYLAAKQSPQLLLSTSLQFQTLRADKLIRQFDFWIVLELFDGLSTS